MKRQSRELQQAEPLEVAAVWKIHKRNSQNKILQGQSDLNFSVSSHLFFFFFPFSFLIGTWQQLCERGQKLFTPFYRVVNMRDYPQKSFSYLLAELKTDPSLWSQKENKRLAQISTPHRNHFSEKLTYLKMPSSSLHKNCMYFLIITFCSSHKNLPPYKVLCHRHISPSTTIQFVSLLCEDSVRLLSMHHCLLFDQHF